MARSVCMSDVIGPAPLTASVVAFAFSFHWIAPELDRRLGQGFCPVLGFGGFIVVSTR